MDWTRDLLEFACSLLIFEGMAACWFAMGATWFRRGLQSSAGHTEGQLPRKYNWKRYKRERRALRSSRLRNG